MASIQKMNKPRNIFNVPVSLHTPSDSIQNLISPIEKGIISNGHAEVITELNHTQNKLEYFFEISSIDKEIFTKWRLQLIKILGKRLVNNIESIMVLDSPLKKYHVLIEHMPTYVLYIIEYALKKNINIAKFPNYAQIPFNTANSSNCLCNQIFESIYNLESNIIQHSVKLVATKNRLLSKVYIPVTILEFQDGKIVSFTGYNGPFTITSSFQNSSLLQYECNTMS